MNIKIILISFVFKSAFSMQQKPNLDRPLPDQPQPQQRECAPGAECTVPLMKPKIILESHQDAGFCGGNCFNSWVKVYHDGSVYLMRKSVDPNTTPTISFQLVTKLDQSIVANLKSLIREIPKTEPVLEIPNAPIMADGGIFEVTVTPGIGEPFLIHKNSDGRDKTIPDPEVHQVLKIMKSLVELSHLVNHPHIWAEAQAVGTAARE